MYLIELSKDHGETWFHFTTACSKEVALRRFDQIKDFKPVVSARATEVEGDLADNFTDMVI